jgi:PAS domain S-box-containing protein
MRLFVPFNNLIFTACLAILLLTAVSSVSAQTIRAGLEQNPPLSFIDDSGKPAGLLVDLLDGIAIKEGWQIEYLPDTFQRCLEKLQNRKIDLMVTIAWSEQRAKIFDYNQVNVVAVWGALYTPLDIEIESFFDLEDKRIAVMRRDIHHQSLRKMLKNFGINTEFIEVDNFDDVFTLLRNHKVDAGVVGRFYAIGKEEKNNVHASPLIFNPIRVHYATAKGGNLHLLQAIDRNLNELKKDPSSLYYQARERWLGVIGGANIPTWITPLLLATAAVIFFMAAFILLLRSQVKARTHHLETEITERARTARALQLSEQNYRELVENANAIILRWNLQGEVTFLNDFAERFFGYMKEELIGQKVIGTIVPANASDGSDLTKMIDSICRAPDEFAININENSCKDGTRVWISWHNQPVLNDNNQLVGILSVGQDVTEQIRAEQKQLQLDRAKNDFISTAAHELRTPLTSIIGYAELLRDNAEAGLSFKQQHEFHSEICDKGYYLAQIIDDLLDISRIQEGTPLPLHRTDSDLTGLVTSIVHQYEALSPEHNFTLEIRGANPLSLEFDRDRITQVLENLLSNATKYSSPDSTISTTVEIKSNHFMVTIADQGIGMSKEEIENIFDHFYRADQSDTSIGGLGLGMSIVKQIVESHGGSIEVASTPGQGTSISFTLPS